MWKYPEDITAPVFTPKEHIASSRHSKLFLDLVVSIICDK